MKGDEKYPQNLTFVIVKGKGQTLRYILATLH